ncbi:hypothetical protein V2W45_1472989 [Cenococcum geophilum]
MPQKISLEAFFKRINVKYITFTLDKRLEHALYKGVKTYSLFYNLILIIVAIYIGFCAGYNKPLIVYNFRAEGLILTNDILLKNKLCDRLAFSIFIKATIYSDIGKAFPKTAKWKNYIYNKHSKDSKLPVYPLRVFLKGLG